MKLKYELEILDIDEKPMAIPKNSGDEFRGLLHINDTTKSILKILENDVTEDEIVLALKKEYDATEDVIRKNVQKVVSILRDNKLLVD